MDKALVTLLLASCVMASSGDQAGGRFSRYEQALWLDRHQFFRMTALPFSAGNMLQLTWNDSLAVNAMSQAAYCDVSSSNAAIGTNAFEHSNSNATTTSIIDQAFQSWAVEASLAAFPSLAKPMTKGDAVGLGVYNAYSQIVWATTQAVGCGYAMCGPNAMAIVCEYSEPGNTPTEPWYIHGDPASHCPANTSASNGLCVAFNDPAYDTIASIPAQAHAYAVFSDYIPAMNAALLGHAPVLDSDRSHSTDSAASSTGYNTSSLADCSSAGSGLANGSQRTAVETNSITLIGLTGIILVSSLIVLVISGFFCYRNEQKHQRELLILYEDRSIHVM